MATAPRSIEGRKSNPFVTIRTRPTRSLFRISAVASVDPLSIFRMFKTEQYEGGQSTQIRHPAFPGLN
jgi:hypothetical protein